ncbi:MAG: siphovirus ReqiPepy6 Gp37-like family protein [Roseburia sp.]|nr:siphovirus ReqiPepy6 Gp37-like family protein [Roseburia sp.]
MDLIYADKNRIELGEIMDYEIDLAYGSEENDFELILGLNQSCCQPGYMVYFRDTEYGGIIDSVCPNTKEDTVTYKGRTWHGILEHKAIEPDTGYDYLYVSGDAHEVLRFLIQRFGLDELFLVADNPSSISITQHQFPRYVCGYTGIQQMLLKHQAKMVMSYTGRHVTLSVLHNYDYSQDEEWTSDQFDFSIEKNYRPVNHLVCLGGGGLKERAVIHLFTDEYGTVQGYKLVDEPYRNEHYILDKRNQVLFGTEEVAQIYDYSNAESVENYVLLKSQPADWETNYWKYYKVDTQEGTGGYKQLEYEEELEYTGMVTKPADWETNYESYFEYDYSDQTYRKVTPVSKDIYTLLSSDGNIPMSWIRNYSSYYEKNGDEYSAVKPVTKYWYTKLESKPADWETNYGSYYRYYSDGTENSYKTLDGISVDNYVLQTQVPTDWKTKFGNYYKKVTVYRYWYKEASYSSSNNKDKKALVVERHVYSDGSEMKTYTNKNGYRKFWKKEVLRHDYQKLTGEKNPEWKENKFYTNIPYKVAPQFFPIYYSCSSYEEAPDFENGKFYEKNTISGAPDFGIGYNGGRPAPKYFSAVSVKKIPLFDPKSYYERFEDKYVRLVAAGLEKLEEINAKANEITADLSPNLEYDINDIVGATEHITGTSLFQPVTKKIVKIKDGVQSIEYKIGE